MELEHERSDRSNSLDSLGTEVWELLQLGSAPCQQMPGFWFSVTMVTRLLVFKATVELG